MAAVAPSSGATVTEMTTPELSELETLLLAEIPNGGGEARDLHVPGLIPRKRTTLLFRLEEMGLVGRYANAHGPQEPWWWQRLPKPPAEPGSTPLTAKGTIYDGYDPNGRPAVWFECDGTVNEWGCAGGYIKAGSHNTFRTWIPLHLLNRPRWWYLRHTRSEVTAWSAGFHCPIHGTCTDAMIKTDKTCALCGQMLLRVG